MLDWDKELMSVQLLRRDTYERYSKEQLVERVLELTSGIDEILAILRD